MIGSFVLGLAVGILVGAGALACFGLGYVQKPAVARRILAHCYRVAHPHWLQISETDATRVCPLCGWHPPPHPE